MSTELTEQWRNGWLENGQYYLKLKGGRTVRDYLDGQYFNLYHSDFIDEVLAEVPTYDQYLEMYTGNICWKKECGRQAERFADLSKKVAEQSSENGRLQYDNDVLSSVNEELLKKTEELEDRLKKAEEVIKFYANADGMTEEEKQMTAEKYHLVYGLKANDYLEKYGVEK